METKTYGTLIEAPELAQHLDDPNLVIVDCRWDIARPEWGDAAYAESHIPGAVFASMDRDLADPVGPETGRHPLPNVRRFAETLGKWGIDAHTQVVAYDQNTAAAASRLWWLLRWLGHSAVAVLNGGFAAWQSASLPVSTLKALREPRVFAARVRPELLVSAVDVEAISDAGSQGRDSAELVVDARAADRFAGRNETIDPVAGHIPGARNHPFARNLDASGKFRAAAELRQLWQETLNAGQRPARPDAVVSMCGSGVTACHNLLALELAGLNGARLYAGSWSEWIKDPARAVEKGT